MGGPSAERAVEGLQPAVQGLTPAVDLAQRLARVDWSRPWFAPFARAGAAIAAEVGQGRPVHAALDAFAAAQGLTNAAGLPLRFVPQHALPPGSAYEAHIHAHGEVPTRENLHDFFNGLIWLHFPRTKAMLNRLQATAIAAHGVQPTRGPLRDAATLFDENAVLFVCAEPRLEAALRGFRWRELFVDGRGAWADRCAVVPFGHALLEKLVAPYKSITAHAWPIARSLANPHPATAQTLDGPLAEMLAQARLRGRSSFAPLPVLGIPHWWPANADPAFYDDTTVFRPGRRGPGGPGGPGGISGPGGINDIGDASGTGEAGAIGGIDPKVLDCGPRSRTDNRCSPGNGRGEESPDSTGQGGG